MIFELDDLETIILGDGGDLSISSIIKSKIVMMNVMAKIAKKKEDRAYTEFKKAQRVILREASKLGSFKLSLNMPTCDSLIGYGTISQYITSPTTLAKISSKKEKIIQNRNSKYYTTIINSCIKSSDTDTITGMTRNGYEKLYGDMVVSKHYTNINSLEADMTKLVFPHNVYKGILRVINSAIMVLDELSKCSVSDLVEKFKIHGSGDLTNLTIRKLHLIYEAFTTFILYLSAMADVEYHTYVFAKFSPNTNLFECIPSGMYHIPLLEGNIEQAICENKIYGKTVDGIITNITDEILHIRDNFSKVKAMRNHTFNHIGEPIICDYEFLSKPICNTEVLCTGEMDDSYLTMHLDHYDMIPMFCNNLLINARSKEFRYSEILEKTIMGDLSGILEWIKAYHTNKTSRDYVPCINRGADELGIYKKPLLDRICKSLSFALSMKNIPRTDALAKMCNPKLVNRATFDIAVKNINDTINIQKEDIDYICDILSSVVDIMDGGDRNVEYGSSTYDRYCVNEVLPRNIIAYHMMIMKKINMYNIARVKI